MNTTFAKYTHTNTYSHTTQTNSHTTKKQINT